MGKKKTITRLGAAGSSSSSAHTNISSSSNPSQLFQQQDTLVAMLQNPTHTARIDALNTIASMLKSYNVSSITQGNLYQTIVTLMSDKMMNVGLAATALLRHVVQICDQQMLHYFIGTNLHMVCYTLLQHLLPCYQSFLSQTVITKGHGLYWYNPNYLNMARMINHIVKILSCLFEVSDAITTNFIQLLDSVSLQNEQTTQEQSQPQHINYLQFFYQILRLDIGTIPPHLIPTIHLPFITQLQLDILHFLRVLCHENITVTQKYLSNADLMQYFLQQPSMLLQHQRQTTVTTQYSPPPTTQQQQQLDIPFQPSVVLNCASDSVYTYQYCQSIVLSNLHTEYQKVSTNSKKQSALATSFTIHSLPHTNIELAMSIAVIIATMLEQINLQKNDFITTEQQQNTLQSLYTTLFTVLEYALKNVDMNQEIGIYTQSLSSIRQTLVTISNGDLTILEQYNLNNVMSDSATQLTQQQQNQQQRQQFKTLNVNNYSTPEQQQSMLVQSLQQLSAIRDGNETATNNDLDQVSAQNVSNEQNDADMGIDVPGTTTNNTKNDEAFTSDEFPLQQLWNDAVYIHNNILTQYFNVKTLVGDCFTMLFTDHVDNGDDDDDGSVEEAIVKQFKNNSTTSPKQPTQTTQLKLFHTVISQFLQFDILLSLLNHSYAHVHTMNTLFNVESYFPSALIHTIHTLYNQNHEDYPGYISSLSYQSTLLRIGSLNNVLFLLQYSQSINNENNNNNNNNAKCTLFTENAQNLHFILLKILSSTSLARTIQPQQISLHTLQEHYQALSSIEASNEVSNPHSGLNRIATILNSTSIDEALLLLQALTTFISEDSLVKLNTTLWSSPVLKPFQQTIAPIKTPIHVTESLTQDNINTIIAQLVPTQQYLYISQDYAQAVQNFIGYFITAQQHYQKTTQSASFTPQQHKTMFQTSPHIEFQHVAIEYISTMAINYPLFGPIMPVVTTYFTSMMSLFSFLKMNQFNCHLLFQFVNLIIDIFSEDDRYITVYTSNKITQALNTFNKTYSEYLTSLKQLKLALKPKTANKMSTAKRGNKTAPSPKTTAAAAETVSLSPQKQQQLIELHEHLEVTTEANSNLVGFIQYKRNMKL